MFGGFNREKMAKAAAELAEHLTIIENIRALQTAQKELAEGMKSTNDRILELYAEVRALRAELKFECLKETQAIVNSVQGGLNSRMENISNRLAVMDAQLSGGAGSPPQIESKNTAEDRGRPNNS